MVNPTITRKGEDTFTPVTNARKLFQAIYSEQNKPEEKKDDMPRIKVSELISKMAFYYEKIRNTVDYKEEYLLRKNAIERILKRQIIIEGALVTKNIPGREIAELLLIELIRAAYLPNDEIKETMIEEIGTIIDQYLALKRASLDKLKIPNNEKNDLVKWILALAATNIEEHLGRNEVELTVINYMYEVLLKNIKLPDNSPLEVDKEIQIFIGIHRNLLKYDEEMLSYILLKHYYPNWPNVDQAKINEISGNILELKEKIDKQLKHPLTQQMGRIISRYTVFFNILVDVIEENPVAVYESFSRDPKAFPRKIKRMAEKRYATAKSKLWRAGVRSIFYIFITKSVFAIILEIPATRFLGEDINNLSLLINICFPAALLFLIILFTRIPSEANSLKIVDGINEIVFQEYKRKDPYLLRIPRPRSASTQTLFGVMYGITFILSFGFVVWTLAQLQFSFISIIIFLFFLALVSFFSIRIRKGARELVVIETEENIFSFMIDFFYVPVVQVGKWLSENFSRINVFVFILDFIIEAPFKIFVAIAEDWTKYVKERKDEIV